MGTDITHGALVARKVDVILVLVVIRTVPFTVVIPHEVFVILCYLSREAWSATAAAAAVALKTLPTSTNFKKCLGKS